jgi:hypothetical protein
VKNVQATFRAVPNLAKGASIKKFQKNFWKDGKEFYLCTPNRNEREEIEKR